MRTITEILPEIEPWQQAASLTYGPFGEGQTNHTYKVNVDGAVYVLRINGPQNAFLGLDRASEVAVICQAEVLGIGPRVLPVRNRNDYLITEYRTAPPISGDQTRQPAMLTRLAETLREIHSMESAPRSRQCSPFQLIRGYLDGLKSMGVSLPDALRPHLRRMEAIEQQRQEDPRYGQCYCHNDYFHFNMLYANGRVTVLDWELSGYGDPFFDLATMPYALGFTPEEEDHWLRSYFGTCEESLCNTLQDMKFIGLIREASWALFHAASEPDPVNHAVDYAGFARRVIQCLDEGHLNLAS